MERQQQPDAYRYESAGEEHKRHQRDDVHRCRVLLSLVRYLEHALGHVLPVDREELIDLHATELQDAVKL